MAPEHPGNLVVFNIRLEHGGFVATVEEITPNDTGVLEKQVEQPESWFRAKWIEEPTEGFAPFGGEVVYVKYSC